MKEANKFLEETPVEKGVLDLSSLLIQPIQRIPRYRLLLEDIIKNTDPGHPDYSSTTSALETIKEVAVKVNEEVRKFENLKKMAEVRKLFGKVKEVKDLITESRYYIYEGPLYKVCRRKNKRFYFVLFNDLLIYGNVAMGDDWKQPKSVDYHRSIDLIQSKATIVETEDTEGKYLFLN